MFSFRGCSPARIHAVRTWLRPTVQKVVDENRLWRIFLIPLDCIGLRDAENLTQYNDVYREADGVQTLAKCRASVHDAVTAFNQCWPNESSAGDTTGT